MVMHQNDNIASNFAGLGDLPLDGAIISHPSYPYVCTLVDKYSGRKVTLTRAQSRKHARRASLSCEAAVSRSTSDHLVRLSRKVNSHRIRLNEQ